MWFGLAQGQAYFTAMTQKKTHPSASVLYVKWVWDNKSHSDVWSNSHLSRS